jgi:hypothetical protein
MTKEDNDQGKSVAPIWFRIVIVVCLLSIATGCYFVFRVIRVYFAVIALERAILAPTPSHGPSDMPQAQVSSAAEDVENAGAVSFAVDQMRRMLSVEAPNRLTFQQRDRLLWGLLMLDGHRFELQRIVPELLAIINDVTYSDEDREGVAKSLCRIAPSAAKECGAHEFIEKADRNRKILK